MANFMAHGPRPRRPPRAAARRRPAAARRDARGRPRLRLATRPTSRSPGRSTSSASRPRRSSSSRPTSDSGSAAAPVADGDRARPRRRADAVRDRGRRRLDEHRLGRRASASWPTSPRREDLWLHVDAAYGGGGAAVGARRRPRARTSSAPTRSRSIRTSGSSRPTTSAGCSSATGRTSAQVFGGRAPEYYRGGETPGRPDGDAGDRRRPRPADQLNFYKLELRGHPPLARAQAVDVLEAPRARTGSAGSSRPTTTWRRTSRRRCAESDDFEALPDVPELSVVCFRHLPGGARRRAAMAPAELDAHQDRLQARARGVRRRLADDDAPARRDLAARRDRQLPRRPRPTSTGCSPPCGAWRPAKTDLARSASAGPPRVRRPDARRSRAAR